MNSLRGNSLSFQATQAAQFLQRGMLLGWALFVFMPPLPCPYTLGTSLDIFETET